MDRLRNIERTEGYPICQENLNILSKNSEMSNIVMSALRCMIDKPRTAVILNHKSSDRMQTDPDCYIYIPSSTDAFEAGEILKVAVGENAMWNAYDAFVPAKVNIVNQYVDVVKPDGTVVHDVYEGRVAHISVSYTQGESWKFYRLCDILEPAVWDNFTASFAAGLSESEINTQWNALPVMTGYIKRTKEKMRYNMHITLKYHGTYGCMIKLPIDVYGDYMMNGWIEVVSSGKTYPISARIRNGYIEVDAGLWLHTHWPEQYQTTGVSCDDILHLNGEVML